MKLIGLVLKKKYQILELVHENERFYSFRGLNIVDESDVFIKVVKKSILLDKNKKKVSYFTEEVKSLARIKHQNVVKVFDVDFKNGILYVVTEFVKGRTLSDYINSKHKFEFWQIIQIIKQLANVLSYAYEKGVKYRTVKHSNIFIDDRMQVKILSFNVPRSILSNVPIPLKENQGIDPDIFFIGVILYELFTHKFPFKNKEVYITDINDLDKDLINDRWNLTFDNIQDPERKEAIEKIIYHAVTRNILDRYKNIDEMLEDLKQFSQNIKKSQDELDTGGSVLNEFGDTSEIFKKRELKDERIKIIPPKTRTITGIDNDESLSEKQKLYIKVTVVAGIIISLVYFVKILLF